MKKGKISLVVLGLAVLSGALIHKYLLEYKDEIDRFVKEYGKAHDLETVKDKE